MLSVWVLLLLGHFTAITMFVSAHGCRQVLVTLLRDTDTYTDKPGMKSICAHGSFPTREFAVVSGAFQEWKLLKAAINEVLVSTDQCFNTKRYSATSVDLVQRQIFNSNFDKNQKCYIQVASFRIPRVHKYPVSGRSCSNADLSLRLLGALTTLPNITKDAITLQQYDGDYMDISDQMTQFPRYLLRVHFGDSGTYKVRNNVECKK